VPHVDNDVGNAAEVTDRLASTYIKPAEQIRPKLRASRGRRTRATGRNSRLDARDARNV